MFWSWFRETLIHLRKTIYQNVVQYVINPIQTLSLITWLTSSLFFAHPAKCVDVPWWRWDSAGSAVDASRRLINRDDLVSSLDIPTCALTRRDSHTSMTQKKAEEVEWQPFLHQEGEDFRAWDGPTAGALHLLASLYDLKRLLYLLSIAQRLPVWFKISFLILRKEVLLEKGEERSVYNRRWFSSHRKW